MKLLVGLGNPGAQYAHNRHNIGFMVMDQIHARYNFPQWRSEFSGHFAKNTIEGEDVILLKPMTFMNLSGQSIGEVARFHKIPPQDIYVFHDELDLSPSKLKHKIGGGVAGHNGLKSTCAHIGEQFHRIRMGIGHPGNRALVTNWVLGDFSKNDHEVWLDGLLQIMTDNIASLLNKDAERYISDVLREVKKTSSAMDGAKQSNKDTNLPLSRAKKQDIPQQRDQKQKDDSPFASLKKIFNQET